MLQPKEESQKGALDNQMIIHTSYLHQIRTLTWNEVTLTDDGLTNYSMRRLT